MVIGKKSASKKKRRCDPEIDDFDYSKIRGNSGVQKEDDLRVVVVKEEEEDPIGIEPIRRKLPKQEPISETSTAIVAVPEPLSVVPKVEDPGDIIPYECEEAISKGMVVAKQEVCKDIVSFKGEPKSKSYKGGFHAVVSFYEQFEKDPLERKKRAALILEAGSETVLKKLLWFRDEHLRYLKSGPMWKVMKLFLYKEVSMTKSDWMKYPHPIQTIIEAFKPSGEGNYDEDCYFEFGDGDNKVTLTSNPNHVAVNFAIMRPKPWETVKLSRGSVEAEGDILAYFEGDQMKKTTIEDTIVSILQDETEDVKEINRNGVLLTKLLTLHLCVTVFLTTGEGSWLSKKEYGKHFRSLSVMNTFDWPKLIHTTLMSSIGKRKKTVRGCLPYLLYLFAGHSTYFKQEKKDLPRMAWWTTRELSYQIDMEEAVTKLQKSLIKGWSESEKKLTIEPVVPDTSNMSMDRRIELLKNKLEVYGRVLSRKDEVIRDMVSRECALDAFVRFVMERETVLESRKADGEVIGLDVYMLELYELFHRRKVILGGQEGDITEEEEDTDSEEEDDIDPNTATKKSLGQKLPDLAGSEHFGNMSPEDQMKISAFWKHSGTRGTAFQMDVNAVDEANVRVIVLGSTLKKLLFDDFVDAQAIRFYTLRRKMRAAADLKTENPKYRNCAYLDPAAWYAVRTNNKSGIDESVRVPVGKMQLDNLDFLLIPMNYSVYATGPGSHWTLLLFDVKNREWQFLNSLISTEVADPCYRDAKEMAFLITGMINAQLVGAAEVSPLVHPISCPQQGDKPDCLPFTCYFMKRYAKNNKIIEMDDVKAREICRGMRHKMAGKMLRPCVNATVWNAPNTVFL